MFPINRGRRLRQTPEIRSLVRETRLDPSELILPVFFDANIDEVKYTDSMPGVPTYPLSGYESITKDILDSGVSSVLVFGVPKKKDSVGSDAYSDDGVVQQAIRGLKGALKDGEELVVIADLCMCEYTDHGHCGVLRDDGDVDNDPTIELYGKIAVSQARAGADIIAPSGMMDGQIDAIRTALDMEGFENTPIMAYSAKYQSAYYGPFRDIANSAPSCQCHARKDRATYQMDPANRRPQGDRIRPRRRCRHHHGETGRTLSGYSEGGCGLVPRTHLRIPGVRRVRHDQGGRKERMDRREEDHDGVPHRHQEGRGGHDHHLLRERRRQGPERGVN